VPEGIALVALIVTKLLEKVFAYHASLEITEVVRAVDMNCLATLFADVALGSADFSLGDLLVVA